MGRCNTAIRAVMLFAAAMLVVGLGPRASAQPAVQLNILLRGQSNAQLLVQFGAAEALRAQVQTLLGFDGTTARVNLIADFGHSTGLNTVNGGTAYGHWLHRSLANATLLRLGDDDAIDAFRTGQADALAGLKTQLITLAEAHPGTRIVPGRFTAVQQAIGIESGHDEGAQFLHDFVETAKSTGLVARLIAQYGVVGLAVAPVSDA